MWAWNLRPIPILFPYSSNKSSCLSHWFHSHSFPLRHPLYHFHDYCLRLSPCSLFSELLQQLWLVLCNQFNLHKAARKISPRKRLQSFHSPTQSPWVVPHCSTIKGSPSSLLWVWRPSKPKLIFLGFSLSFSPPFLCSVHSLRLSSCCPCTYHPLCSASLVQT